MVTLWIFLDFPQCYQIGVRGGLDGFRTRMRLGVGESKAVKDLPITKLIPIREEAQGSFTRAKEPSDSSL